MILVVGSQRTGSTLMASVIGAHPQTHLVGDIDLSDLVNGKYQRGDVLHAVAWTARYSIIDEYFPNNRYVFMLRDLRGIVSSMLTLQWVEKYAPEEICRAIVGVPDWRKQYEATVYLRDSHKNLTRSATACAYLKSYQIVLYRERHMRVFPVRYEEFVCHPKEVMGTLLDLLELRWDEGVLEHHATAQGKEFAGNDPKRPIDTDSLNKWKANLSGNDLRVIYQTAEELDGIFGGFSKDYALL